MKFSLIFLALFSPLIVCAQGIKLEAKTDRFVLKKDKQVGVVIVDNQQNLEWSGCLVGQDYVGGQCTGVPQRMTWLDAASVAKKAGNGWRLPSHDELMSLMAPKTFQNDRVHHLSKLFDEGNSTMFVYWSATGVTDTPNRHWVAAGLNDLPQSGQSHFNPQGFSRLSPVGYDAEEYEVRLARTKRK